MYVEATYGTFKITFVAEAHQTFLATYGDVAPSYPNFRFKF